MDAAQQVACIGGKLDPINIMSTQLFCVVVLSHFFELVLKPFGQPAPLAQILAGLVLGPSVLLRFSAYFRDIFIQGNNGSYFKTMALLSRILVMFLIGLEVDVPYLKRKLRLATIVGLGAGLMCCIFAATTSSLVYYLTYAQQGQFSFSMIFMLTIANSASPLVFHLAAELKIATSDVGQVAMYAAFINDMCSLSIVAIMTMFSSIHQNIWRSIGYGIASLALIGVVVLINMYLASWLNQQNRNRKYLKNAQVLGILSYIVATAMVIEYMGYNSVIPCFLLGMMFPRGRKTARTLLHKLTYPVHTFILPIYFGFIGFQADVSKLGDIENGIIIVIFLVLLSIGGKICGTFAVCHYLQIPLNEVIALPFLLSLKGHVDLLIVATGFMTQSFTPAFTNILLITVVVNSVIVGPVVAFMVRRERKSSGYGRIALELQSRESELRILACVHGPRHVSTMVWLIAAASGYQSVPTTPYLMHLIELPEKTRINLTYHQLEMDELSDEEEYGGNDVLEINEALDAFILDTGIMVHQVKAVSPYARMYKEVCSGAEDARASIILLPFHKHHRIDGKMENGKQGIRTTNQKVLRHASCTVAILIDRGLSGNPHLPGPESMQHVATLFFGGPDDREALAYSVRMSIHPQVNLTVIRFLPESSKRFNAGIGIASPRREEFSMEISGLKTEEAADNAFVADFYSRYVASGQVGYVEKYVDNGKQTAAALRDMGEMYSLFIIGKGGRALSPLTTEMSDWEECPELGTVGDLLASSDFDISGSVLVIQQNRHQSRDPKNDLLM